METGELHQTGAPPRKQLGAGQRRPNEFFVFGTYNGGNRGIPPRPPGGDWSQGEPDMESWQASVDRRLKQGEDDIRSLLRYGVAAVVALALAIGGLYLFTGSQLDPLKVTVGRLDERTAAIQKQQDGIDAKLDQLIARK